MFKLGAHRPAAAALVAAATFAGLVAAAPASLATQVGDAGRFQTWTGYDAGRRLQAVVSADLNGDGAPDAAWARSDFFTGTVPGNSISVQLNLGDGTLSEPVHFQATDESTDIAAADLEGDGDLDLIVSAEGSCLCNTALDLFVNDGTGSFTRTTTTAGVAPNRLAIADFNGDGRPDVALANYRGENFASVALNDGSGGFRPEDRYRVGDEQGDVDAGDLDGDGDLDLAVSRINENTFAVEAVLLTNDGSGTFTVAGTARVENPDRLVSAGTQMAVADWNADGLADIALAGLETRRSILINQGALRFSEQTYEGQWGSFNLEAIDIDQDGDQDLLNAAGGSSSEGTVVILPNQGDGTFSAALEMDSSHQPADIDAADYNRDGLLDLAVANSGSGTGAIHPKVSEARFATPPVYETSAPPFNITTADFDVDGDLDVAASILDPFGSANDGVQIMANDGAGNLANAGGIQPAGQDPMSIQASDLNGDGASDLVWMAGTGTFGSAVFLSALNNGDGTFAEAVVHDIKACGVGQVSTADADNDGDQDVLATSGTFHCGDASEAVSVSLNNGNGAFAEDYLVTMEQGPVSSARGADVNGDGLTDIVAAQTHTSTQGDVSVALGTGGGQFAQPQGYTTGDGHRELKVVDLDADGDLDLATVDFGDNASVLLNDGSGDFSNTATYEGEHIYGFFNAAAVDVGDINGDGAVDIALANFSGNNMGVHFGRGDGTFEPTQVRYGVRTALRDLELADFDGDGRLDVAAPNFLEGNATPSAARSEARKAARSEAGSAEAAAPEDEARGVSILINREEPVEAACTIRGTSGPDTLVGTDGPDVICGFGGDDVIQGRGGNDILLGAKGHDEIRGGTGNDVIKGGDGRDFLGAIDNVVRNDFVLGGNGRDKCRADRRDKVVSCP